MIPLLTIETQPSKQEASEGKPISAQMKEKRFSASRQTM
jgi:hypothetical protein